MNQNIKNPLELHQELLLAEYNASRESFLFMYQTSWQIGSILIAGIFVFIGLLGSNISNYPLLISITATTLIIWLLFFKRHRQVAYVYWNRLLEIEKELGMNSELSIQKHFKEKKIIPLTSYACAVLLAFTMILWLFIRYALFKIYGI